MYTDIQTYKLKAYYDLTKSIFPITLAILTFLVIHSINGKSIYLLYAYAVIILFTLVSSLILFDFHMIIKLNKYPQRYTVRKYIRDAINLCICMCAMGLIILLISFYLYFVKHINSGYFIFLFGVIDILSSGFPWSLLNLKKTSLV